MIKGCHKRIIFLKNTGSELFEEAYFIIKPGALKKGTGDVVEEATRIVNGLTEKQTRSKKGRAPLGRLISYLLGLATGALVALLVLFI